jgi:hypothetical protein
VASSGGVECLPFLLFKVCYEIVQKEDTGARNNSILYFPFAILLQQRDECFYYSFKLLNTNREQRVLRADD